MYASRRGEKRPAAKMTAGKVRLLRYERDRCDPPTPISEIAKLFGLSTATVHAVLTRRYWSHV